MINHLDKVREEKNKHNKDNPEEYEDSDSDFEELMMEDKAIEEDIKSAIFDTFGVMFKTHKSKCGGLIDTLFNDCIPNYLRDEADIEK